MSAVPARRLTCPRLRGSFALMSGTSVRNRSSTLVAIPNPAENQTTFRLRDERSSLPRCHPHSAMPHSVTDGKRLPAPIGAALYRWRSAPEPTGVPGVHPSRVGSGGSRVHSPSPLPRFPPSTGSLCQRADGYSSRSTPMFECGRSLGWALRPCQGTVRRGARLRGGRAARCGAAADSKPRQVVGCCCRYRMIASARAVTSGDPRPVA